MKLKPRPLIIRISKEHIEDGLMGRRRSAQKIQTGLLKKVHVPTKVGTIEGLDLPIDLIFCIGPCRLS